MEDLTKFILDSAASQEEKAALLKSLLSIKKDKSGLFTQEEVDTLVKEGIENEKVEIEFVDNLNKVCLKHRLSFWGDYTFDNIFFSQLFNEEYDNYIARKIHDVTNILLSEAISNGSEVFTKSKKFLVAKRLAVTPNLLFTLEKEINTEKYIKIEFKNSVNLYINKADLSGSIYGMKNTSEKSIKSIIAALSTHLTK